MRKRRNKVRKRNATAKALAKPQYRQRVKPNKKRDAVFQGFSEPLMLYLRGRRPDGGEGND